MKAISIFTYMAWFSSVGTMACKSLKGQEFIWVEVQHLGKKSVWPSNRLS